MKKLVLQLAFALLLFSIIWLGGLWWFVQSIPTQTLPITVKADSIVVLTGGSKRIEEGIALLKADAGRVLFISGAGEDVVMDDVVDERKTPHVELGYKAQNTRGNAEEAAEWVNQKGFKSLRLVTSAYHMPRALVEFEHAMPNKAIIPHPVQSERVVLEKWWRYPGTRELLVKEYHKFIGSVLFYYLKNRGRSDI